MRGDFGWWLAGLVIAMVVSAGCDRSSDEATNERGETAADEETSRDTKQSSSEDERASDETDDVHADDEETTAMKLQSSAFADGEKIPEKYSCEGAGDSPPLSWSDVPDGAESFVLLCADPDAPSGTFKHWSAYDIPAGTTSLPEGVEKVADTGSLRQGTNDFGEVGYGPPCPPPGDGAHRYQFRVLALDTGTLDVGASPDFDAVESAAERHKIGEARLTGTYSR